jgi:hypothetical protein
VFDLTDLLVILPVGLLAELLANLPVGLLADLAEMFKSGIIFLEKGRKRRFHD